MTPSRPYLVRALVEWITDNDLTPYVLVDCRPGTVSVPREFVKDDQIVLNLSVQATRYVEIGNESVALECRFGGRPTQVDFPIGAVLAVYAKENGAGMSFELDEALLEPAHGAAHGAAQGAAHGAAHGAAQGAAHGAESEASQPSSEAAAVEQSGNSDDESGDDSDPPPDRPTLRIVR